MNEEHHRGHHGSDPAALNDSLTRYDYRIHGMKCASCEFLIEREWKKIPGIHKVHVSHSKTRAKVWAAQEPALAVLNEPLKEHGYRVEPWEHEARHSTNNTRNTENDYYEISAFFLFFVAAYLFLNKFDLLPQSWAISESMSYGVVFVIGLLAAVSTCMAVAGGLVLAMGTSYSQHHPEMSPVQRLKPHLYFNLGRIISYTGFGAAIGAFGSLFTLSPRLNGWITVIASLLMIAIGLQLLHLLPGLKALQPKMPKVIAHKLHDFTEHRHPFAPFLLGGGTFFLPCGFTQALQLYVLSNGDAKVGALTMLVFSLGTLPALLSLSFVSSFAQGGFQRHLVKFAGVLVVFLGIMTIDNGLSLAVDFGATSSNLKESQTSVEESASEPVPIVDGKQIVEMKVDGFGYSPDQFTLVEGVPVEWRIDGREAYGCAQTIVIPETGLMEYLSASETTVITFTPEETGQLTFTCSMGMVPPGTFNVVAQEAAASV